MAGNVNKVFLMGNLTRDIEMRQFPSGGNVGSFGLAVNEKYKDRNDQWVERVDFIDCDIFGKRAEAMAKYLGKGQAVFIEGRLRLDQWEDKQGQKRSKLKVVVTDFQFVGGPRDGGGGGGNRGGGGNTYASAPAAAGSGGDYEPVPDDDIPF